MALEPRDYADLAATTDFRANRKLDSAGKRPIPPFAWAALGLAGLGVAYFATLDTGAPKLLTDPDSENFSTSTALPPVVPPRTQEPSAPSQDNVVKIEPQLPVAPPPPIITPAIPQTPQSEIKAQIPPMEAPMPPASPLSVGQEPLAEAAPDNSEEIARLRALREAEAERLRALAEAQEQERQERLKSALVAFDGTDAAAGGGAQNPTEPVSAETTNAIGDGSEFSPSPASTLDPSSSFAQAQEISRNGNMKFLDQQAKQGVDTVIAGKLARPDAMITQGAIIHGVLESAINSDLPGNVRGVVSQDVWSLDGGRILIPKGSRLIGEYSSGIATGQTRILIAWNRVITPDGVSVLLGSVGTDALGRSGMTGKVDRKTIQRFGSAFLLTVIGGVSQYVAALGQPPQIPSVTISTVDPITGAIITTTTEGNTSQTNARQIGAQTASQSLQQMANEALRSNINVPPTIHVRQGERIIVMVRRDLDFSKLYLDPVLEEYQRLKNGPKNVYK
ncbi:MAG: type IV secretion system protein VirB10 [Rhizobiaceae bacterium]